MTKETVARKLKADRQNSAGLRLSNEFTFHPTETRTGRWHDALSAIEPDDIDSIQYAEQEVTDRVRKHGRL